MPEEAKKLMLEKLIDLLDETDWAEAVEEEIGITYEEGSEDVSNAKDCLRETLSEMVTEVEKEIED